MYDAPFPPLLDRPAGLDKAAAPIAALRRRMADIYGAPENALLPVRGVAQAIELLQRYASDAIVIASPGSASAALSSAEIDQRARDAKLIVLDERFIEFSGAQSYAQKAATSANVVVIRSLEVAYGLAGAPCAAIIGPPAIIASLERQIELGALPAVIVQAAEAVLGPARVAEQARRIEDVKQERRRLFEVLRGANIDAAESEAPFVLASTTPEIAARLKAFSIAGHFIAPDRFRLLVRSRQQNDLALSAFGIDAAAAPPRTSEVVRETAETSIAVRLDLDRPTPVVISTGVPFYDHMLTQIAVHAGFSLTLTCVGDTEVDAHHTIEDCALAIGQALSQALGQRRGIARYGFTTPMDEAQAQVAIDLSGRPYLVFNGAFDAPLLGAYPTEMTEHVFRSLSQTMGAAIHLAVTGENDHHKTEACFKAFGRALRQAIRAEGAAVPSSKGVL